MELIVESSSDTGIASAITRHRDEVLLWETKPYIRTSKNSSVSEDGNTGSGDGVFGEINRYLKTLPMATQDIIWKAYKDLHELFSNDHCPVQSTSFIMDKIKIIYDQIPYQGFMDWARGAGVVNFPKDIASAYTDNSPEVTTYIQSDYFELAAYAILIRLMFPIWGEYIHRAVNAAMMPIRADHKEYKALLLLQKTYLLSCAPYNRLRDYVDANLERALKREETKTILLQQMMAGLSPESYPVWMVANALVRRIVVISQSPKKGMDAGSTPNIVADVYHYTKSKLTPRSRSGGTIIDNVPTGDDSDSEPESVMEGYKNRQLIPDGEIRSAIMSLTVSHYWPNVPKAIDPTMPIELVEECMDGTDFLKTKEIMKPSMILIQWVLASAMPMNMIPLLDNLALRRAAAITQALLWHWHFTDLAAMITATPHVRENEFGLSGEFRRSLTEDQVKSLNAIYPNPMRVKGKAANIKHPNQGVVAIEMFFSMVQKTEWKLHCTKNLLDKSPRISGSKNMRTPANIRQRLADLLIHLHQKRIEFNVRSYAREGAGDPIQPL